MKTFILIASVFCLNSAFGQTTPTTNGTTDPNYEINLAKSQAYVPYVQPAVVDPVMDEAYYIQLIADIQAEIIDLETQLETNMHAALKIEKLQEDLFLAESNLTDLQENN